MISPLRPCAVKLIYYDYYRLHTTGKIKIKLTCTYSYM